MNKLLSLSILEYEPCLGQAIEQIREILSYGIDWLHIDIMRKPFIASKTAFPEEQIIRLYEELKDEVDFDFHLMVSEPDSLIRTISAIVPDDKRSKSNVTIHREAYRYDAGYYTSKDYDLLTTKAENAFLAELLREVNRKSGEKVLEKLEEIKRLGFRTGLALEPGTCLENISEEMLSTLDMILLMSVRSGEGGQYYIHEVTSKIKEANQRYNGLVVQVDGGINEKTLPEVLDAGANNIVIGSYITNAKDFSVPMSFINRYIKME